MRARKCHVFSNLMMAIEGDEGCDVWPCLSCSSLAASGGPAALLSLEEEQEVIALQDQ